MLRLSTSHVFVTTKPISFVYPAIVVGIAELRPATTVYVGKQILKCDGCAIALCKSGKGFIVPFRCGEHDKSTAQKNRGVIVAWKASAPSNRPNWRLYDLFQLESVSAAPLMATGFCRIAQPVSDVRRDALSVATDAGIYIVPICSQDADSSAAPPFYVHGTGELSPHLLVSASGLGGIPNSVASWAPVPGSQYGTTAAMLIERQRESSTNGSVNSTSTGGGDVADVDAAVAALPWRLQIAYTRMKHHDVRSFFIEPPSESVPRWNATLSGPEGPHSIAGDAGGLQARGTTASGVADEALLISPMGLCSVSTTPLCPPGVLLVACAGGGRVATISPASSYAFSSMAAAMESARCGLGVIIDQSTIPKADFDAVDDARQLFAMTPLQRIQHLQIAHTKVDSMRKLLRISWKTDFTGFLSLQFRRSLRNRIVSLSHVVRYLREAHLDSLIDHTHPVAEMTRSIENAFSAGRSLAGSAMPNALAFCRALSRANFVNGISAGYGISGRQFESARALKCSGKLTKGYLTDYHVRPTIAWVLGEYKSTGATSLVVPFPRFRTPPRDHEGEPSTDFKRDVAYAQAFVDATGKLVRQSAPRRITAVARAGTFPTQNRALLTELIGRFCDIHQHIADFDDTAAVAAAAAADADAVDDNDAPIDATAGALDGAIADDGSDSSSSSSEDGSGAMLAKRGRRSAGRAMEVISGIGGDGHEVDTDMGPRSGADVVHDAVGRSRRERTRAQPRGGAILSVVEHGHGASEMRRAVSYTELHLPGLIDKYQGVATNRGEQAALTRILPKIRLLLSNGIEAASRLIPTAATRSPTGSAGGVATLLEGDDGGNELSSDTVCLAKERKQRYTGWLDAINDMALANLPTPLTRLDLQTVRRGWGSEPKFCEALDQHAERLDADKRAGT